MTSADTGRPEYVRIAAEIAQRIDSGDLQHGDRLPTSGELAAEHGVSRTGVANRALRLLDQSGYTDARSGRITTVSRPTRYVLPMYLLEGDDRGRDAFDDAVKQQGGTPYQHIRVETVTADTHVSSALGLPTGELVLVRRRTRYIDSVPYCIADSYFPHSLVADTEIANPADIKRGGRHVLSDMGYGMARHQDRIQARWPRTHELAELVLNTAIGMPLICHYRTSSTSEGTPVRYMCSYLPGDRWEITYEVES